jgi:glycosyltransferase involved in cell wall biosynthesis
MHVNVAPVALPMALRGAALVVVLHGVEAWRPLRLRERLALRRARALIAVSAHTAGRFQAANSALAAQPIAVCHHCLPELLTTAAPTAAAPPAPPYALIVARMAAEERYKGHDLLLEIWPEVRSQVPTARLLIAGGGDDRPRLEAKRDALGLQPAVEFLGRVPDEDLRALYQNCAFFVMPSRHEGFGLVFLEAMRARKACIGAMGSASEIIEHEKTGFVFDADDRTGIRDACVRLFSDPEFAARMGDAGRRREAEVFSFAAFRAQLLELLRLPG